VLDRIQDRHLTFEFWPFFDQSEMETMERVTHKTLIALNIKKRKTQQWTMESFIEQRDRCQRHIIHQQQEIKEQMVCRPTLALLPV
jgi:hypothetical protein